jgi:hypothetical protein
MDSTSSSSEQGPPLSFYFAPEIEQALVSLVFYAPERLATVQRELDPEVHFIRPELRHILEAINLAYRELGTTDFASVIQTLRELGRLEDCGGPGGVNSVLEQYRYGFSSSQAEIEIFEHYIQMLQAYALARANQPPVSVYRFLRGDLTLAANKAKAHERCPDYLGEGKIAGRLYRASAWAARSQDGQKILSVSLCPK